MMGLVPTDLRTRLVATALMMSGWSLSVPPMSAAASCSMEQPEAAGCRRAMEMSDCCPPRAQATPAECGPSDCCVVRRDTPKDPALVHASFSVAQPPQPGPALQLNLRFAPAPGPLPVPHKPVDELKVDLRI